MMIRKGMRKRLLTSAIVIVTSTAAVVAQADITKPAAKPAASLVIVSPEKARADEAWKKVGTVFADEAYKEAMKKFGDGSRDGYMKSPDFRKWWGLRRLQFREEGLKFWHDFPDDPRRYLWLMQTTWTPPFYWKDPEQAVHSAVPSAAPMDEAALKAWDDIYLPMRAEFMASPLVTDDLRGSLLWAELMQDGLNIERLSLTPYARAVFVRQLVEHFQNMERDQAAAVADGMILSAANMVLQALNSDGAMEASFIEALKLSKRTRVQLFANGREQVAKLRSNPFELTGSTMTGEKIDVGKLRGKYVLVDIWSNTCTGCIAAMPTVQATYQKYQKQGFEVVGVWLGTGEAKEKVDAQNILARQGVTYPNVILAGPAYQDFVKKYSIISVPVTFLLDKNGHLITNDVEGSKLEQEVKRLVEVPDVK